MNPLIRASRALVSLLRNPDDLPQVFEIIESLSQPTYRRTWRRLRTTPAGLRLLGARSCLSELLADRARLATLPDGSLGRAYLAFMEREGISAEGIVRASEAGGAKARGTTEREYVPERLRDSHDLWHVVTGYEGDLVGELCLLAFTFAQLRNPALLLIVGGGASKGFLRGKYRLAWHAFDRGRRAAWLPEVAWEAWLAEPLEAVRARLRIDAPPVYEPVRSSELRARGKLAAL